MIQQDTDDDATDDQQEEEADEDYDPDDSEDEKVPHEPREEVEQAPDHGESSNKTETDNATVKATRKLVKRLDMIPVDVLRDVPGFVENRILYAIMREALHLLDQEVASAEDIDAIVKWGIGYKLSVIGPLELLDVAGLDIYHSVASYLNADLNASSEVSSIIRDKVAKGELGIKTGKGLFEYQSDEIPALMKRRMRLLLNAKRALTEGE